ncbi:hypothetical protein BVIET440_330002 [Burkholderia vietnamiensis]
MHVRRPRANDLLLGATAPHGDYGSDYHPANRCLPIAGVPSCNLIRWEYDRWSLSSALP